MLKQNRTVSEKMATLSELVAWFESEAFSIEDAMAKYVEAEKLSKEIESDLQEFKNEITVLKKKFDQD